MGFGEELRRLRTQAGITVPDLAARTGIFRDYLVAIEADRDEATAYTVERITGHLRELGIPEDDLARLTTAQVAPQAPSRVATTIFRDAPTPTPVSDLAVRAVVIAVDVVAVLALSIIMFMPGGCLVQSRHDDVRKLSPYGQLCEFGGFLDRAHPATRFARYSDGTSRYCCDKHDPTSSVHPNPFFHALSSSPYGAYIFLLSWYAYASGNILKWMFGTHRRGSITMMEALPAAGIAGFWFACWWFFGIAG